MTKITILRKWNNPQIEINVTNEAISISMSLGDFVRALTDEVAEVLVTDVAKAIGNPALLMTAGQLERKMVAAVESKRSQAIFAAATERIIERVKEETAKVM